MGYIYKIKNLVSNKIYIGETKQPDPETRWKQHKNCFLRNAGCPALRDAVKKYGINNFIFEILLICFDKDRFEYEIEYIKKFNSIVPNGYNIANGGQGGGFLGKKHSEKTKKKLSDIIKKRQSDNPNYLKNLSNKAKIIMNKEEIKNKIKEGMKKSEKWNIIKNKPRKQNNNNNNNNENRFVYKDDIKNKIKTINQFDKWRKNTDEYNKIIIQSRINMANAVGLKIQQINPLNNEILNIFDSAAEAARQTGISKTTIKNGVREPNIIKCGYYWRKIN